MASSLGWVEEAWDDSRAAADQVVHSGESFFGDKLSCNGAANPWGHHHDVQSWDFASNCRNSEQAPGLYLAHALRWKESFSPRISILSLRLHTSNPSAQKPCPPKCHTLHSQSFEVR